MGSNNEKAQYRLGIVLGFGALLWSGTYNALAKGLTPFLSPISLLILSESLTALFIIMTFGLVPLLRELKKMDAQSIRIAVIIGFLNSAIAPLLFFSGLARTSAMNASMLSSAEIICVLVAAHFVLKEQISRMQIVGGAVVMAGVLTLNFAAPAGISSGAHLGDALLLAGAVVSGYASVLFKKYLSHVMPELAILIRNISGIVAVSVLAVFIQVSFSSEVASFPLEKVLLLLAFTFFSRYLNLTFFYEALDRLKATTLSLIQIAQPLSGILFAFLILGETIHSYQILGCSFILLGLMLEQTSGRTLTSIRTHSGFFHLVPRKRATVDGNIGLLPKNV